MNKRYLSCILFVLMIILSSCTLEDKAGSFVQLPPNDTKVYQDNATLPKDNILQESAQNNSNQDKSTKPKPPKEQQQIITPVKPTSTPEVVALNNEVETFINSKNFSSLTAYFIWIDLSHQKINIFNGASNNWHLVKSMICSSGKASTPTVKGNFTVGIKGNYFIADGGARCKYYTQAPYTSSKYGQRYAKKIIHEGNRDIVLTYGIGNGLLPIRFFAIPEIIEINLE